MAEGMEPHRFQPGNEFPRSCVKCGRVASAPIHAPDRKPGTERVIKDRKWIRPKEEQHD